jgi:hypothetical protein
LDKALEEAKRACGGELTLDYVNVRYWKCLSLASFCS